MKYVLSLITGITAISGNILGGVYAWMNLVLVLIVFVVLDWIGKPDESDADAESYLLPEAVLLLHVVLHTAAILTLFSGAISHSLHGYTLIGAILSTGLNSGVSGIVSAHELIHRPQKFYQLLGIWNLLLVHYTHFFVEHIYNHHKNVGTAKDPATAMLNESVYRFILRTIPAQFISAVKIAGEKTQLVGNIVLRMLLLQLVLDMLILLLLGPKLLAIFIIQSIIAIVLLEYVNYVEHYGLSRDLNTKVNPIHSWQSNSLTSRISLLELSRHSDHHLKASKPYHKLASHATSPAMPSGYFGMFYISLIPPLWFKIINPIIQEID